MRNIISIDWDFFLPDAYDTWTKKCIDENEFYLIGDWAKTRREPFKPQSLNKFWKTLRKYFILPKKIYVSDSHSEIFDLLFDDQHLYLFDSHHDCFDNVGAVDCGNWGMKWLLENETNKITWVHQLKEKHKKDMMSFMCEDIEDQFISVSYKSFRKVMNNFNEKVAVDFIHICRSGCWSPPWLDKLFLCFIDEAGLPLKNIESCNGNWDPFTDRLKALSDFELKN